VFEKEYRRASDYRGEKGPQLSGRREKTMRKPAGLERFPEGTMEQPTPVSIKKRTESPRGRLESSVISA